MSRASAPPASDFELWMIEGEQRAGFDGRHPGRRDRAYRRSRRRRSEKLDAGAVLAVSLEPAGGSPTGQPTGPVVAAGDLKNI